MLRRLFPLRRTLVLGEGSPCEGVCAVGVAAVPYVAPWLSAAVPELRTAESLAAA